VGKEGAGAFAFRLLSLPRRAVLLSAIFLFLEQDPGKNANTARETRELHENKTRGAAHHVWGFAYRFLLSYDSRGSWALLFFSLFPILVVASGKKELEIPEEELLS